MGPEEQCSGWHVSRFGLFSLVKLEQKKKTSKQAGKGRTLWSCSLVDDFMIFFFSMNFAGVGERGAVTVASATISVI